MKRIIAIAAVLVAAATADAQDRRAQILAAAPAKAAVAPKQARKLLVFSVTNGFRHPSIPTGLEALKILGKKSGAYKAVLSNDLGNFQPEKLRGFDAVCFLNTTGAVFASKNVVALRPKIDAARRQHRKIRTVLNLAGRSLQGKDLARVRKLLGTKRGPGVLTAGEVKKLSDLVGEKKKRVDALVKELGEAQEADEREQQLRQNLVDYVKAGGGFVGIHAATDTYKDWPPFLEMIGGVFAGHPWTANKTVAVKLEDAGHPLNAAFAGKDFSITDEIYQIKGPYSRQKCRVLLRLDTTDDKEKLTGIKGSREDNDYAVAWVRRHGEGRVFYCSLGHNHHIFWNPTVLRHYLAGIQFACGDLEVETRPSSP